MPTAIVLAGGLGSRMRKLNSSLPKPMLDIAGKPFLAYLLDYLCAQGISKTILSVGYQSEAIIKAFRNRHNNIEILYAIEDQPLGTGGAIKNALSMVENTHVFVLNGDTYFPVDLSKLLQHHENHSSDITLALKHMIETERYGKVVIDEDNRIVGFIEKEKMGAGLINGGIYVVCRDVFKGINLPLEFSFERNFLARHLHQLRTYGIQFSEYFIDIGVPQDYDRARAELKVISLSRPEY